MRNISRAKSRAHAQHTWLSDSDRVKIKSVNVQVESKALFESEFVKLAKNGQNNELSLAPK